MTEAQALENIAERWAASWAATQPSVPYGFDNESFRSTDPAWATVTVQHTASRQLTQGPTGSRRFEYRGTITVMLFVDIDTGRSAMAGLVASVKTALEAQSIGGAPSVEPLTTYAATSREVVSTPTMGKWFREHVVIPFIYYETK